MDLVCGTDQLLYFPTKIGDTVSSKFKLLPSKHCFVMKVCMFIYTGNSYS